MNDIIDGTNDSLRVAQAVCVDDAELLFAETRARTAKTDDN